MSKQEQLIQQVKANNDLLQRLLAVQERQAQALERLSQQFDQVTAGGNAMTVEVVA